jgi:hypothetical protein
MRNPRKIKRDGKKGFCGAFRFFECQRDFRDGGDGEADRPVGPRHARDSRRGGRQRRRGGTRRAVVARVRAVPSGFVARTPREEEREMVTGVSRR